MADIKRITFKRAKPNPLFEEWLQELFDEAKAKDSKLQFMLKEALVSLSKYPLPLKSGCECAVLKGFGKKLCLFLDKRLEAHNSRVNDCISTDLRVISTDIVINNCANKESINKNVKELIPLKKLHKKQKSFKPAFRSGGYAILVALLNHHNTNHIKKSLTKEELVTKAQLICEESFTRPKPETYYTAWSNMTRLIAKGLVTKSKGKKPEFSLSDEGLLLAMELLKDNENQPTTNDIINKQIDSMSQEVENNVNEVMNTDDHNCNVVRDSNETQLIELATGSFDVILLIDKHEISGVSNKNDPTVAQFKKYPDLKHEFRHLKVGDFIWIARDKTNTDVELVLPYIVERKRMDDLGASIKDGRFHEQKFRLRKCCIPNIIYLVENYGRNKHVGLPMLSLMQAMTNTRVQDGFKVHITDSLTNSARFLAMMSKRLTIEYKDKNLRGQNAEPINNELMTFSYFNKASSKNKALTVTETFIKLLLQLKGVSVEKALAITNVYNTPKSLIETYKLCNPKEGEKLLANLKYGDSSRNVGPSVSKSIYQLLTINDLQ